MPTRFLSRFGLISLAKKSGAGCPIDKPSRTFWKRTVLSEESLAAPQTSPPEERMRLTWARSWSDSG